MNASAHSPQTLIIGIGNPLRCDDAAGRVLAEEAANRNPRKYNALLVHQLTPDLAADIAAADAVIFADASVRGERAPRLDPVRLDAPGDSPAMSHGLSPEHLIHLASFCFGKQVPAWTLAIPATKFRHGTRLSPETQQQVEQALALLEQG